MAKAVIALGTNLGERKKNIENAVEAVKKLSDVKILKISSVIETEPWGVENQPMFLNCCILIETTLPPLMLLGECLGIEAAMGRVRGMRYGPRVIDLDLITYEGVTMNTKELTLPHPRAKERDFVMIPLKELEVTI